MFFIKVGGSKGDVTKRWLQVSQDDRKEKAQSLEVFICKAWKMAQTKNNFLKTISAIKKGFKN